MVFNAAKSNYMIFTRTEEESTTRLIVNCLILYGVSIKRLLGVGIPENLS